MRLAVAVNLRGRLVIGGLLGLRRRSGLERLDLLRLRGHKRRRALRAELASVAFCARHSGQDCVSSPIWDSLFASDVLTASGASADGLARIGGCQMPYAKGGTQAARAHANRPRRDSTLG